MNTSDMRSSKGSSSQDGEYAIEVINVSKKFRLYHNPVTGPVNEMLFFWKRERYYKTFEAVRNVSLKVRRGEIVGIVGPNGSGKTTLLKMIAGLLTSDAGEILVRGKLTALLALGVGVHPEFSGRENILFGGLLLGMSPQVVAAKTPSIIDFAELGEFIDRPFRTYSSGMKARLLFSISMSIDPDILIVDEALATGDSYFVRKCAQRIAELCSSGATILFVSHNLSQIKELCSRAILVIEGQLMQEGHPDEIVAAYNAWSFNREVNKVSATSASSLELYSGTGEVQIQEVSMLNSLGVAIRGAYTGDSISFRLRYSSTLPVGASVCLFLGVMRVRDGQWLGEVSTNYYFNPQSGQTERFSLTLARSGEVEVLFSPLLALNDEYSIWLMVQNGSAVYCEYKNVSCFFAGRAGNIGDRNAAYWQPCVFVHKPDLEVNP
jgi:ABC-type polysaccharide/polyol phosphate transport system ATPase subunit